MRLTVAAFQAFALLSCTKAENAYLWTIDRGTVKHATGQVSSISSTTASSIIARRRGMADERYLQRPEESALSEINKFSGYQRPLFSADTDSRPSRLFIRINGFDGSISQFSSLPDVWVEDATQDLLDDFKAHGFPKILCEYDLTVPGKKDVDMVYSYVTTTFSCLSTREVEVLPALLAIYSVVPEAADFNKNMNSLLRILSHLSVTEDVESTILVLPPQEKLKKVETAKRSMQAEEPFELSSIAKSKSAKDQITSSASNSSGPLPAVVPQCFRSEKNCNDVTNSCSGHGSCYKAHAGCFKCKCVDSVVRDDSKGRKVISWGGNACQKKDVSIPFALFATFGVVMTAIIAGSVGMLYSMGAQELPSVLGAGVSGPRAQK